MKQMTFFLTICCALIALPMQATARTHRHRTATNAPDKAHLQKIWDGWSTLNPANVAAFYATGSHTFFDIAPVKYSSWDEYQNGVRKVLADYKGAKFTVNDDAELHPSRSYEWGTATINFEMTHQNGKVDTGTMRWTVVFHNEGGKWLIVHEHVSVPMQ